MSDCFICEKHKHPEKYIGEVIAEQGGLVLTHFPFIETERATRGHLIIEPRRHIVDFSELTDEEAGALGPLARAAVSIQKSRLEAEHVYFFRINDKVPHLHFHLIPRYPGTPRDHWGVKIMDWPDRPSIGLSQIAILARDLKNSFLSS